MAMVRGAPYAGERWPREGSSRGAGRLGLRLGGRPFVASKDPSRMEMRICRCSSCILVLALFFVGWCCFYGGWWLSAPSSPCELTGSTPYELGNLQLFESRAVTAVALCLLAVAIFSLVKSTQRRPPVKLVEMEGVSPGMGLVTVEYYEELVRITDKLTEQSVLSSQTVAIKKLYNHHPQNILERIRHRNLVTLRGKSLSSTVLVSPRTVHQDITMNADLNADLEPHISDTDVMDTIGYIDVDYARTTILDEKSNVYSYGIAILDLLAHRNTSMLIESQWDVYSYGTWVLELLTDRKAVNSEGKLLNWIMQNVMSNIILSVGPPDIRKLPFRSKTKNPNGTPSKRLQPFPGGRGFTLDEFEYSAATRDPLKTTLDETVTIFNTQVVSAGQRVRVHTSWSSLYWEVKREQRANFRRGKGPTRKLYDAGLTKYQWRYADAIRVHDYREMANEEFHGRRAKAALDWHAGQPVSELLKKYINKTPMPTSFKHRRGNFDERFMLKVIQFLNLIKK